MPSPRFMRLPEEKRTAIWEAAVQEFVEQPYEKVSINKIIKQAGISRGSFYTYFEDKRDLLIFILWGTKKQWHQFCLRSIEESGGEFFEIVSRFLEEAMAFCRHNDMFSLHKNLIMYPEPLTDYLPNPADCEQDLNEALLSKLDRSRFRDPSDAGVNTVAKIAAMILFSALADFCMNPDKEELIRENFLRSLDVLRHGAYRDEEAAEASGHQRTAERRHGAYRDEEAGRIRSRQDGDGTDAGQAGSGTDSDLVGNGTDAEQADII